MKVSIPHKIHYCWFGGNPLPTLALRCIASWRKFLPDYEIICWNESNLDIRGCCEYVQEAYESRKWAFVSDYARFKILYEQGGVYFDTDVEVIQSVDDIIEKGPFMGLEKSSNQENISVNPGLGIAANPGLKIYKEILETYQKRHFLQRDGSLDLTTVVTSTTTLLKKYGLKNQFGIQYVGGIYIYPAAYFCPIDSATHFCSLSPETRTIHHFSASWWGEQEKYIFSLRLKLYRFLPVIMANYAAVLMGTFKFKGMRGIFTLLWKHLKYHQYHGSK